MDKLKVVKFKITSPALVQLQQLRLSLAHLNLTIRFSRKLCRSGITLYQFDPTLVPAAIRPRLLRLTGLTLRIVSGEIVEVYRDTPAFSNTEEGK